MSKEIDEIKRLAGLTGNYILPSGKEDINTVRVNTVDSSGKITSINAYSKGLSNDELQQYKFYPIIDVTRTHIVLVENSNAIQYSPSTYKKIEKNLYRYIDRTHFNDVTGDNIIIICCNSTNMGLAPTDNFWCKSMTEKYMAYFTEGQPLLYNGKFLWWYGHKTITGKKIPFE